MTREEAINELNNKIKLAEYVDSDYIDFVSVDAVKMAISALSVPDTNVGDTISRRAAIDAIIKADYEFTGILSEPRARRFEQTINALPSAQPEIVRCKDCKWYDISYPYGMVIPDAYHCKVNNRFYDSGHYCSDGERKEDE